MNMSVLPALVSVTPPKSAVPMKLPATTTSPLDARTATAFPWSALGPPMLLAHRSCPPLATGQLIVVGDSPVGAGGGGSSVVVVVLEVLVVVGGLRVVVVLVVVLVVVIVLDVVVVVGGRVVVVVVLVDVVVVGGRVVVVVD